jgi:hypothetical protein
VYLNLAGEGNFEFHSKYCTKVLNEDQTEEIIALSKDDYGYNMFIDELPAVLYNYEKKEADYT